MPAGCTQSRRDRIKKSGRIKEIIRSGKKIDGTSITIRYLPADGKAFAVLVSKRVGGAVQRNKVKRWIRSIYRAEWRNLSAPRHILFIIKQPFELLDYHVLQSDLSRALKKLYR